MVVAVGAIVLPYKSASRMGLLGSKHGRLHPSAGGVTIKATNGALVIGIYAEGVTPGECNVVVEQLGDYLKDQGI